MSCSSWLERSYQQEFQSSPNYKYLGVNNIAELLVKMSDQGMVLLSVAPETKEKYVISVGMIERRQNFLKLYVQELLDTHSGEIKFSSFEDLYKDKFKVKLMYDHYSLTDLDHLCDVLKDILVVGNSSGEKVIKAVKRKAEKRKREDKYKRKRNYNVKGDDQEIEFIEQWSITADELDA
ncbi:endonuclease [Tanacetum coccineum]